MDFLLSTYENAYLHNRDLLAAQAELTKLNERLEETVEELEKARLEAEKERQAVLRAKQEWERTFDALPDLIAILDDHHRIVRVNRAMAGRLGCKPDECAGRICYDAVHGLDAPPAFCPHVLTLSDGREHMMEVHEDCLGGDFLVSTSPLADEQGHRIGSVHVSRDITSRKLMEEELRTSRDQLEMRVQERTAELRDAYQKLVEETEERQRVEQQLRQAQKMEAVGTLAGGIAHDFNNILAAILGNAEIAMDDLPADSKARHNVERILKGSLRARELVKQILSFSRKDAREPKHLRLGLIVQETFSLLRASIPATIEMKLDFSAENDSLYADPSQLEQVILNLATNARDAMREKGGCLTLSVSNIGFDGEPPEPDMRSGQYLMVAVKDTGCGMAEDVQQRIFEPFFTTKEQGQGTGLGLAVAYGIVKGYNGAITVASRPGEGSVFRVFLPTAEMEEETEGQEEELALGGHERILFVDDEPTLVEVADTMLSRLGYTVTTKTDPRQALQAFLEDPEGYDIVVTDQTMPEMTGLDLVRCLFAIRPDIPTILCTGYSEAVSKADAERLGIRAFVMKPLSRLELAKAVRQVAQKVDA